MYSSSARGGGDHNFGWIGLLGLAGLSGLMRRNPERYNRTTNSRP